MARSNTIVVRVLGNTKNLSRSLVKASRDIGFLNDRLNRGLTKGFKVAGIAAAGFGAAAVAAGAVGAAALIGMTVALAGLGVAFAAQSEKVQSAWKGLGREVSKTMKDISKPLISPLVQGAKEAGKAFKALVPYLEDVMKQAVPLVNDVFKELVPLAKALGPVLVDSFKAGAPVVKAFVKGLTPLTEGIGGFFKALDGKTFGAFTTALMEGIGGLLPALGRMLNALTPIGTAILDALLPALGRFADYVADKVVPAAEAFADWAEKNEPKIVNMAKAIGAMFVAFKSISVVTALTGALGTLLSPIGLIALAVLGLAAGFTYLWNNSDTFRTKATEAFNAVKAKATELYEQYWPKVVEAFDKVKQWWTVEGPGIVAKAKATWDGMMKDAGPVLTQLVETIKTAFDFIKIQATILFTVLTAIWDSIGPYILPLWNALWSGVMGILGGALKVIQGILNIFIGVFKGDWKRAWDGVKQVFSGVWSVITGILKVQLANAQLVIRVALGAIKGAWNAAWSAAKTFLSSTWNGIKSAVSSGINSVVSKVKEIKGKVTGALSGAGTWLISTGENIIRGLIGGIGNMASTVATKARSVVEGAISAAKSALRINSPSKVFRDMGYSVGEGLAMGIDRMGGKVALAGGQLAKDVARGFSAPELSLEARGGAFAGAGTNITFQVNVPPTADKASIGREIQSALDEWKRVNG